MADNNSPGLGIITLSSGRKKIRVGTFEALLPSDAERIPEPLEITDVRTVREYYEQYSRSQHNGQEVRRKAAEEDIILERFDDVSKVVVTFGNQVVEREYPYSSGGKNKMAFIPVSEDLAQDWHPMCVICHDPVVHPIRCMPARLNKPLYANNEGLLFGHSLNPALPYGVDLQDVHDAQEMSSPPIIGQPSPAAARTELDNQPVNQQHAMCRRCLALRRRDDDPVKCNAHSEEYIFSPRYPQRLTSEACYRAEEFYHFCPDGCRNLGNCFSLGPHIDVDHAVPGVGHLATSPHAHQPHAVADGRARSILSHRLREYEYLVAQHIVPGMVDLYVTLQAREQELTQYRNLRVDAEDQTDDIRGLKQEKEALQEHLALLQSEFELLSAKYASLEKTREDAPPSNLSSMVQRLNELTKETNKCRSEMTALMTREAELVIQNQRLRQERDALRSRAPEPLQERSGDQIKRLTEELAQQTQQLVQCRREKERALRSETQALDTITDLDAMVRALRIDLGRVQLECHELKECRGDLRQANEDLIAILEGEKQDLQRALCDAEHRSEFRLRQTTRALTETQEQLRLATESLGKFESRYGRDGWGDIPIVIYGLSPRPPHIDRPERQPHLQGVDIVVHHGYNQTFRFNAGTGTEVRHFQQRLIECVGADLATNYRLMAFKAVSADEHQVTTRIGNFLPHSQEVHMYLVPHHFHQVPLPNPLDLQHYRGTLNRYFGHQANCPTFPAPDPRDSFRRLTVEKSVNTIGLSYGPIAGTSRDSPTYNPTDDTPRTYLEHRRSKRRRDFSPLEASASAASAPTEEWPWEEAITAARLSDDEWADPPISQSTEVSASVAADGLASGGGGEVEQTDEITLSDSP